MRGRQLEVSCEAANAGPAAVIGRRGFFGVRGIADVFAVQYALECFRAIGGVVDHGASMHNLRRGIRAWCARLHGFRIIRRLICTVAAMVLVPAATAGTTVAAASPAKPVKSPVKKVTHTKVTAGDRAGKAAAAAKEATKQRLEQNRRRNSVELPSDIVSRTT